MFKFLSLMSVHVFPFWLIQAYAQCWEFLKEKRKKYVLQI